MDHRILSAPVRPVARALAMVTAASLVATLGISFAVAQQAQKPAAGKPAAPANQAKPAAGNQAKPAAANEAKPSNGNVRQMPQLLYSEWTKFCVSPNEGKDAGKDAKDSKDAKANAAKGPQVCLTGIDGRLESGQPLVTLVAIEPSSGDGKHLLRVTLPVGMHLQHGTRLIIDHEQPMTAPYVTCFLNGCISDYDLAPEVLAKMKKAQAVIVQGINYDVSAISVPIPLKDFAKVHDGPATDPKVLAEMEKQREEALKKKAAELKAQAEAAQKKLGQSQPAQGKQ